MPRRNASVLPFPDRAVVNDQPADRPFVETSLARLLCARMAKTHEQRAISIFAGPWGIGKTSAINHLERETEYGCFIVKVDQGNSKRGATPSAVLQQALEAVAAKRGGRERVTRNNAYWALRLDMHNALRAFTEELWGWPDSDYCSDEPPLVTFIFDEAQRLSRAAIEMLRDWNDRDRSPMPLPIGLIFVGNNEFSLKEDHTGQSVLSGAMRSRALFIEQLEYMDVSDADLSLFFRSRGVEDAAALAAIVAHFKQPRIRRDLRNAETLADDFRLYAGDGPVTAQTVRDVLNP